MPEAPIPMAVFVNGDDYERLKALAVDLGAGSVHDLADRVIHDWIATQAPASDFSAFMEPFVGPVEYGGWTYSEDRSPCPNDVEQARRTGGRS